jgi:hypothetical protein
VVRSGECGTEPPGSITWRDSWLTENLVAPQGGLGYMKIDNLLVSLLVFVGCLVGWLVSQLLPTTAEVRTAIWKTCDVVSDETQILIPNSQYLFQ